MMESQHLNAIFEFFLCIVGDWYTYVLTGIITLFFIPVVVLILFYAVAVFLYAHKSRRRGHYKDREVWSEHFWNSARLSVCTFINLLAKYWHAHDVVGLENIPDKGPALLCIYHGTLPIDVYYILAKLQLSKRRRLKVVVDHFLFRLPGLKNLLEVFGCFTGPATECVRTLRKGHLLAILPGGVREAIFATDEYDLKWNNRQGFAKVALASRVPIIPVFTTNSRESFKVVKCVQGIFQKVYETTKIPLVLYYGGFPVKMTTYFGPKIDYDLNMSPKEVSDLCADAISNMIKEYQRTPGTVIGGLKDRWLPQRTKNL
ncbi:DGAT1/2-independent enzyme synthesizing storage lipids [Hydra vulgaris]|uniref:Transmembrane protein 68 n=1 Tax=Hydra vulgaris TaxID=6087 RepID=T2M7C4_HYDVU|nr:transmembrane protein 68 [Hydra vulgaris]